MAKDYSKIEVKNNMNVDKNEEEVVNVDKKKPLKRVVSVEPKKVKRGLISRLVTGILGPEGLPGIGSYVADEIIKPAIKNLIVDSVTSGINKMMYGEKGGPSYRGVGGGYNRHPQQYTNYTNRYNTGGTQHAPTQQPPTPDNRVRPARYGVNEYNLTDRYDASHVLTSLIENAQNYGSVSVADYYDLIGVDTQFTDHNYGWGLDGISRATIVPIRNGYVINFPPVEVL